MQKLTMNLIVRVGLVLSTVKQISFQLLQRVENLSDGFALTFLELTVLFVEVLFKR